MLIVFSDIQFDASTSKACWILSPPTFFAMLLNPDITAPPAPQQAQQQPSQQQAPSPIPAPQPGSKVARVRYQVPPLARPLDLNIAMNDQSGTRILRQQQVQGGEYVSIDVPYAGIATVTVRLDNQQVWQERYN